ncbi:gem-associated protein 2 isoform X2 [Ooceraea biroi]|uniref:gem-associated protein 2 isoform X2 n=1 Tax=Ooceraea biroi TaxID=2015173 RepID=UPI0005BE4A7A|nr:gem-associated protein 2 isoform X2 [Ooceraea biroi]
MMDCLKQPVFMVGSMDKNINFALPPSSGEEYLQRVIMEAKQCDDVVVADIDPSCMKEPTRGYFVPLPGCVEAPPKLGPTIEWQHHQVSEFSKLRLYVSNLKYAISIDKRKWKPPDLNLPDINEKEVWINLCLDRDNESNIQPTLNTLFCFKQSTIEQILEYLVQFVETERRVEYKVGLWIYTLLVILEQPLQPDVCYCLRSLARACSAIRADSVF